MNQENKKIAVTVKNLHISYRGLKKTSIRASWKKIGEKVEIFEALKGISFEVEEGKILGLIGFLVSSTVSCKLAPHLLQKL